jgi:dCTP deaminase
MAFWSSEKLKQMHALGNLIEPFDKTAVKHGAYELSLGPEAFLTSDEDKKKKHLADGEQLVIPPGQFGLLLTEEIITIPNNAIGFISIKAGLKFRGLVNVSGFHVDPGFSGRLKFSVYNAGSQNILLERKQRVFLLWLSDLDQPTSDVYTGSHANQNEITTDDVMRMQGEIASPAQLQKDIQTLEHKATVLQWMLGVLVTAAVSIAIGLFLRGYLQPSGPATPPNQAKATTVQPSNTGGASSLVLSNSATSK